MKKILILIDWFLPGYKAGGPITSVYNMVSHLKDEYEFYILTSDRDIDSTEPYSDITPNKWIKEKGYFINYISIKNNKRKYFRKIIKDISFHAFYFNSLFSIHYTLSPVSILRKRKNAKIILAPRGMLGAGAVNIKKTKKQLFIKTTKFLRLFNNICWHATNVEEKNDIINHYGKNVNVFIASNISFINSQKRIREKKDKIKFLFYSRIVEKKNLHFALNIFKNINTFNNKEISYEILGPIEDKKYYEKCQNIIALIKNNIKISFLGSIAPDKIVNTLSDYHFLFFPTKHENYGHVIIESLGCGTPIITSTNTPWRNLEEKKIGWDIDLKDEKKFIEVIEKCISMSQEEYDLMSENCYNYAKAIVEDKELKNKYLEMFT